LLLRFSIGLR